MSKMTKDQVEKILYSVGLNYYVIIPTLNRYWQSDEPRGPWFVIVSNIGIIEIGWRKRVISINWEYTGKRLKDPQSFSTDTCWEYGCHAWSELDAVFYIKKFLNEIQYDPKM